MPFKFNFKEFHGESSEYLSVERPEQDERAALIAAVDELREPFCDEEDEEDATSSEELIAEAMGKDDWTPEEVYAEQPSIDLAFDRTYRITGREEIAPGLPLSFTLRVDKDATMEAARAYYTAGERTGLTETQIIERFLRERVQGAFATEDFINAVEPAF